MILATISIDLVIDLIVGQEAYQTEDVSVNQTEDASACRTEDIGNYLIKYV